MGTEQPDDAGGGSTGERRAVPRIPPPLVAGTAAAVQLGLVRGGRGTPGSRRAGAVVAGAALGMIGGAGAQLLSARTTISPHRPAGTTVLVRSGLFALSRNPIYLGIAGLLIAHAVVRRSMLALLPAAAFVVVLDRTQIPDEEHALAERFGEEFAQYAAQVRRWC